MKKVLIFGAGQIGRGFIGDICHNSGYFLVFVDVNKTVIDLLNAKKEYPIWMLRDNKTEKIISGLKAYHISERDAIAGEISDVDLIFTAVGVNNLASLSPVIVEGIKNKIRNGNEAFLNIIICENLLGSSNILYKSILSCLPDTFETYVNHNVGLVETVVSRMVSPVSDDLLKRHPLLVTVEPYDILPVDKRGFKGDIPDITGFKPVDELFPYVELKLFMHNLSHASFAYLGYLKGYEYIWECIRDPDISKILNGVISESKEALIKKHKFAEHEIDIYVSDLLERYKNKSLNDTVTRVGRDPLRKLGPDDRLAGAINLCLSQNIFPESICYATAACLRFYCPDDIHSVELQKMITNEGIECTLRNISNITDGRVIETIIRMYMELNYESSNYQRNRRFGNRGGRNALSG